MGDLAVDTALIHLDTDIGGDLDDLCALAMLLRWPGLTITGITTVTEDQGRRAGYVQHVLALAEREDIPLAAGADVASGVYRFVPGYPPDADYWPPTVQRRPGPVEDALERLKNSIERGAAIVAIGQYTNLRLLDEQYPGILQDANLFLMGGCMFPAPAGYPQWANEDDYNIQLDVHSARYVLEHSTPTLIPIEITCQTALKRAYLPRLAATGPLGQLLAHQSEAFARDNRNESTYGVYAGLPDDIINFQHDPLACAIALGWRDGVQIETIPLEITLQDGWLYERPSGTGKPMRVVTAIDGERFSDFWCDVVCGV